MSHNKNFIDTFRKLIAKKEPQDLIYSSRAGSGKSVLENPDEYMSNEPPTLLYGAGGSGKIVSYLSDSEIKNPMTLITGTAGSGKKVIKASE